MCCVGFSQRRGGAESYTFTKLLLRVFEASLSQRFLGVRFKLRLICSYVFLCGAFLHTHRFVISLLFVICTLYSFFHNLPPSKMVCFFCPVFLTIKNHCHEPKAC